MTQTWYEALRHPKRHPHTKFVIPPSSRIGDIHRTWCERTESAITICLPKSPWEYKNVLYDEKQMLQKLFILLSSRTLSSIELCDRCPFGLLFDMSLKCTAPELKDIKTSFPRDSVKLSPINNFVAHSAYVMQNWCLICKFVLWTK